MTSHSRSWRPAKAFVLAAGLGKRMRHLSEARPKPLVELGGKALIDHVLDRIAAEGIAEAVVNVHYKADQIEQHLARRARPKVTISDERALLLDTGGGVAHALTLLGDQPFLIHNSDSVWVEGVSCALRQLCEAFDEDRMDSLMLLASSVDSVGYDEAGDFQMASDGRLTRRAHGHIAPFAFTGVSIAHPRMFEGAPEGPFSLNRLWSRSIEAGRLFGLRLDGIWMHVGTPEAVVAAEAVLADPAWRR